MDAEDYPTFDFQDALVTRAQVTYRQLHYTQVGDHQWRYMDAEMNVSVAFNRAVPLGEAMETIARRGIVVHETTQTVTWIAPAAILSVLATKE